MHIKKKLSCLCICAALLCGLFAGCGQTPGASQDISTPASASSSQPPQSAVDSMPAEEASGGNKTVRYHNPDTLEDGGKFAVHFVAYDGLDIYMTVDRPDLNIAGLQRDGRELATDTFSLYNYDISSDISFYGRVIAERGPATYTNNMSVSLESVFRLAEYIYEDGNWAILDPGATTSYFGICRIEAPGYDERWMQFPLQMDEYFRDELKGIQHVLTYDEAVTVLQRYQSMYHFYYSVTGDWHDAVDLEGNPADLSSYTFLEDVLLQSFNDDGFCIEDAAFVDSVTIGTDIAFALPCEGMDKPAHLSLEYESSADDLDLYPDKFTQNGFTIYYETDLKYNDCDFSILSEDGALALEGSLDMPPNYPDTLTDEDFKNMLSSYLF